MSIFDSVFGSSTSSAGDPHNQTDPHGQTLGSTTPTSSGTFNKPGEWHTVSDTTIEAGGIWTGTTALPNVQSPWPMQGNISQADLDLLEEKNTMLKAACDNQAKRIEILTTTLKFFTHIEGKEGDYAKQMLEEDENG